LVFTLMLAAPAPAQESPILARPRVAMPTLTTPPPVIDGDLSDAAWSQAAVIDALTEVDPSEGIPADPPTNIYLARDAQALYIAFECFEPNPEAMVVQDMKRDGGMSEDESIKVVLDTFSTGKTGLFFVVSAAGGRMDALLTGKGPRSVNASWDTAWNGRSRILADRWIAELAIPFASLSFPPDDIWRINFERYHGARRAYYRWAGAERQYRITTISKAGEVSGLAGIPPTAGIEVVPYIKGQHIWPPADAADIQVDDWRAEFGGDLNWKITPNLRASLSANTDFAETEVDAREINLTRFPTFFPEKRDFFLQDANLFEFGWESGFRGRPRAVPFVSRRIGLSAGHEIPIELAGLLAGRVGSFDLGVFTAHTAALAYEDDGAMISVPASDLIVARPSWRISEALTIGAALTHGSPDSTEDTSTYGLDINYLYPDFAAGDIKLSAWGLISEDEGDAEGRTSGGAWGARGLINTTDWFFALASISSDDSFRPALGYVQRPGERNHSARLMWTPRPQDSSSIRRFRLGLAPSMWTDAAGQEISRNISMDLFGIEWQNGDSCGIEIDLERDRLTDPFSPVDGSEVPAGTHSWQTASVDYSWSRTRPISGSVSYEQGGYYNGDIKGFSASGAWIPNPNTDLSLTVSENRVSLPASAFTTRLGTLSAGYSFSPDTRLESFVQMDNVTDTLGFQGRLRWTIEDGRELFFVANSNWAETESGALAPTHQDYTIKLEYTLRF
jgi:hypothetical protein